MQFLQSIIVTALNHFDKAESRALKLANLEVLINSVLYNPSAALHFIETFRPGMARTFFDSWFGFIKSAETKLPRVHDKKLSIVALCALLELAPGAIPDNLKDGWPAIVGGIIKVFHDLPKAVEGKQFLPRSCSILYMKWRTRIERQKLEEALETEADDDDDAEEKLLNLKEDDGEY